MTKYHFCVQTFHHLLCFRLSLLQRKESAPCSFNGGGGQKSYHVFLETLLVILTLFQPVSSNLAWMCSSNPSPLSSTCHCLRDLSLLPSSTLVKPLLEKHNLPQDELSSYHPISNLNFVLNILEHIIHARISSHSESFPSITPFHSAYR